MNLFRDPATNSRSAVHCAWHPDGGRMLAVAYANTDFQSDSSNTESYVWNIENSNKPEIVLKPPSSALCLEYNPKDSHIILGGLYSGQVNFWLELAWRGLFLLELAQPWLASIFFSRSEPIDQF